jgi:hypothetical protein
MNLIDDECIYKSWIHSNKEDNRTQEVYRPSSFEFPPSRGRDGFKKNRRNYFSCNRWLDDKPKKIIGYFNIIDENKLSIKFEKKMISKIMNILSCEKDLLVIQKKLIRRSLSILRKSIIMNQV